MYSVNVLEAPISVNNTVHSTVLCKTFELSSGKKCA